jgi:hypothetical protein
MNEYISNYILYYLIINYEFLGMAGSVQPSSFRNRREDMLTDF